MTFREQMLFWDALLGPPVSVGLLRFAWEQFDKIKPCALIFFLVMEEQNHNISQQFLNFDPQWQRYQKTGEIDGGNYKQSLDWWLTLLGLQLCVRLRCCRIPIPASGCCHGQQCTEANKKKRKNGGRLNLRGGCRVCIINYVILSSMQYQNSGKPCVPATSTVGS